MMKLKFPGTWLATDQMNRWIIKVVELAGQLLLLRSWHCEKAAWAPYHNGYWLKRVFISHGPAMARWNDEKKVFIPPGPMMAWWTTESRVVRSIFPQWAWFSTTFIVLGIFQPSLTTLGTKMAPTRQLIIISFNPMQCDIKGLSNI